ncbi:ankyrin repeat domain-containing protein 50 [Microdochium nivale]|nr:ankyrin repeat domain-containing protein 50 [Microdochium nivale]
MALLDLPTELILTITRHLASEADASALSRTCRPLREQVTGALYRRNARDSHSSALRYGAMVGHVGIVRAALEHGGAVEASIDRCSKLPATAARRLQELRATVAGAAMEPVSWAGSAGGVSTRDCFSPLACAALYGQVEVARVLLDAGADVEAVDINLRTPLFIAARSGRVDLVRLLLDRGADAGAVNADGETVLWPAVFSGSEQVVRLLVGCHQGENGGEGGGLDVNAVKTYWARTALMLAAGDQTAGREMAGVMEALIEGGADVGQRNHEGRDALSEAVRARSLDRVRWLVGRGASAGAADNLGVTALGHAAQAGEVAIARFLIEQAGAEVDHEDAEGLTPLARVLQQGAAVGGDGGRAMAELLRSHGAETRP